jgi:Spy/CpxP family protein refolding chaperone
MTADPNQPSLAARKPGRLVRRLLLGAAFAATFAAGGLVFSGAPAAAVEMAMSHAGMHAMMHAHIEKMLTEVEATPDQKARINAILTSAMQSMGPMHQKLASAHGDLHRLLTAPTIDRAALEQLRSERMADFDQASKSLVQSLADAAEVLTPAQRAKLGTLMAEHHPGH